MEEIQQALTETMRLIYFLEEPETQELLIKIADEIVRAFKNGKKVLLFGNGGSAADAQHIAAELAGKFKMNRKSLPALALTVNPSAVTAISNDYGYEYVFSRQLEGLTVPGDIVIGISTSGKSRNVINGIGQAMAMKAITVVFTGKNGLLAYEPIYSLKIPSSDTARIQEAHIIAGHLICEIVEKRMFGEGAV